MKSSDGESGHRFLPNFRAQECRIWVRVAGICAYDSSKLEEAGIGATIGRTCDLLFTDTGRLLRAARELGSLQILYSGKAHPADDPAKEKIRQVIELARQLNSVELKIVYLENYDWSLGAMLTGGVDLWLNTPKRSYEASGTSGMKAALNGVPSLSVLDGWWIEGWNEGVTGWAVSDHDLDRDEANSLYEQLERKILPLFYRRPDEWRRIMRSTIALNGSYFNTQRMLKQYVLNAYFPERRTASPTLEPRDINLSASAGI